MADILYNFLQSTADFSLSAQKHFWSAVGVKPSSAAVKEFRSAYASEVHPPLIITVGGHQIKMNVCCRRLAGISGGVAVAMAAFSAHRG